MELQAKRNAGQPKTSVNPQVPEPT